VKRGRQTVPQPQTRIPPSYLAPLTASAATLTSAYGSVLQAPRGAARDRLTYAITAAAGVTSAAATLQRTVSAIPVVILDAQTWADDHSINVDVEKSAGQVVKKITDQAASILSNTAGILSGTGTLLVDASLILLISLYFVSDGARIIRRGLELVPDRYHQQATFFVKSADTVLGQSIRANIACAAIAGVFGGGGALVLGVPYAVLIGVTTAVLQLIPIIGAILVYIPPIAIALLFTTPTTAIILLVWFIVFEQIVTNVVGPRLTSKTVGIHPLEAMAAALVGFPLAGFLGSFFAVPVVGLTHVLVKQALASRKEKKASHATVTPPGDPSEKEPAQPSSGEATAPVPVYAAGPGNQ
jgi:predicted PurR-regulated permease PerM